MRILLVEDDDIIGDGIKFGLTKHGFSVDWFLNGIEGRDALESAEYDAVVLDLSLPGADGLDVLQWWRKSGRDTPVLILTARGQTEQKVEGLNLGADDYLGKPFALDELIARLRALIRRRHGTPVPTLAHGSVLFNPGTRMLTRDGTPIALSQKETALVEIFLLNKNAVLPKAMLEEKLYAWGEEISSNAIEVHVHNIRKKLGNTFIKTIKGVGYMLGEP